MSHWRETDEQEVPRRRLIPSARLEQQRRARTQRLRHVILAQLAVWGPGSRVGATGFCFFRRETTSVAQDERRRGKEKDVLVLADDAGVRQLLLVHQPVPGPPQQRDQLKLRQPRRFRPVILSDFE